jgi:pimeloyl-ACP methyl ester carboxylesterase
VLERSGGIAPDLIGFGRSAKGGHLDYSVGGLADFVMRVLDDTNVTVVRLVGHDWGALVALELAARAPERIESVALISPTALIAGHAWSGFARVWSTRLLGELAMGAVTRGLLARRLRTGCVQPDKVWPRQRLDAVWRYFDQGTQRAILLLHRRTPPDQLSLIAQRLHALRQPALVLRGERDPWVSAAGAEAVAGLLPQATVAEIPAAGHWPWLEGEQALEWMLDFVNAGTSG